MRGAAVEADAVATNRTRSHTRQMSSNSSNSNNNHNLRPSVALAFLEPVAHGVEVAVVDTRMSRLPTYLKARDRLAQVVVEAG